MTSARPKNRPVTLQPPAGHGGRPSLAESEQISARIIEAAKLLFLRDGFAQTSMDAIAAEIGISKRTLYSRHPTKAALFEAMVIDVVKFSNSGIKTDDFAGKPLREQLLTLSERILAVLTSPIIISLERVVIGESRQFPQLADLIYKHGGDKLHREVSDILCSTGKGGDDLARDVDIFLNIVILPPLRRAVLQFTAPGIEGVDRAVLERTIDIFVNGSGDRK